MAVHHWIAYALLTSLLMGGAVWFAGDAAAQQTVSRQTLPEVSKVIGLSLGIVSAEVKKGTWPKFTMTVTNLLAEEIHVVGPAMSTTEHASELIVLGNKSRVEVPTVVGHSRFPTKEDFISLSPAASMTVKMRTRYAFYMLELGDYEAYVRYRPDPWNWNLEIKSPTVSFSVVE